LVSRREATRRSSRFWTQSKAGKTKVWITNPTQSNSGATVFFGFLNYFAGNPPGKALTQEQLDSEQVCNGITRFLSKFDHTPPSTKTLMDDCAASPDRCDAVFTYEALVIEMNQDRVGKGQEPMTVVYPQGSLAFADSPLGFLPHGDNNEKKANFDDPWANQLVPLFNAAAAAPGSVA
jgi:Ca-activated chloride channel homolog